jgi:predicted aspartyl protease
MSSILRACLAAFALALIAADDTKPADPLARATELFRAGQFDEADKACAAVLRGAGNDAKGWRLRGRIALLGNRLDDAEKWLTRALELAPEDNATRMLLAEAYCRRDDFARAAPLYRAAGREARAKQLESLGGGLPYQFEGKPEVTHLDFVRTDPLPVVRPRVNGSAEANFIIDTGGGELILDTEFAKTLGVTNFGEESGEFGGGKRAPVGHGRVDALTLGEFVVRNVPVSLLPTRRLGAAAGGKQVDGILGTVLLYHFLPTLDYPGRRLTLQRRQRAVSAGHAVKAPAAEGHTVPFWMSGDHYMVAQGTVNGSKPMLFFVDTGLAGAAFTCPESTANEAGIKPIKALEREGVGGGGKVRATPFVVDELTLGPVKSSHKLAGVYGVFPASLEHGQGYRIGGLISHQFFKPYAVTFDFDAMRLYLTKRS